ncbi:MAG TPA: NPCBM/NEW2 domain-containing protein [Pirellulales bacterium]|nr:NPCBM/NEW2 domain-containing protein [Pirellulales bacterium]
MLLTLLLTAALAAEPQFDLRTTDGQVLSGTLVELSAGEVALDTVDGRVTVPSERVAGLAPQLRPAAPAETANVWIEMVDGSSLPALSYAVSKGQARFELPGGAKAEISTRSIAHVRFIPQNADRTAQWDEIINGDRADDVIVIRQKGGLDFQAGVLGDVNDATVDFKLDDETLAVKRARVEGLVYFHKVGGTPPSSFCRLSDAAGSRLEVHAVKLVEGRLRLTTSAGLQLDLPLEQIVAIDGKIQYLSDLTPESSVWAPYFGRASEPASLAELYRPRMNQAADGGELRLDNKAYAKGLCVHSRTELVYRLPAGQYRTLKALAGLDDRVRPEGHVRLLISGDGKNLFESILTGHDDPRPLDVDVSGVSRLKILVDFGEGQEVSDHLDLCEVRILK